MVSAQQTVASLIIIMYVIFYLPVNTLKKVFFSLIFTGLKVIESYMAKYLKEPELS